jgi:hypothetical protein
LGPLEQQYRDAQKELERSQKTQAAMDDFTRKLGEAGGKVETEFTERLTKATPDIVKFLTELSKVSTDLMDLGGILEPYVKALVGETEHPSLLDKKNKVYHSDPIPGLTIDIYKDSPFMKTWDWLKKQSDTGAKADELDSIKKA